MFGTQNDANKQPDAMVNDQAFKDIAGDPNSPAKPTDPGIITPSAPPINPQPSTLSASPNAANSTPASMPAQAPAAALPATMPSPLDAPSVNAVPGNGFDDELLDIKHNALTALSPLVSHIEQTPTEKFRTLMMMIQGADDKSLIKPAYEAAKAIQDDKERAQALLDIVNEINYFTQPKEQLPPQ